MIVARRAQGARPDLGAPPSGATSWSGTPRYWRRLLTEAGFDIKPGESPIVPVMLYNAKLAQDVARDLFAEGIYVVGFFFPVVRQGAGAHPHPALGGAREAPPRPRASRPSSRSGKKYDILGKSKKEIIEKYGT